jgi:hypothetical protein
MIRRGKREAAVLVFCLCLVVFIPSSARAQAAPVLGRAAPLRAFDELFPDTDAARKAAVFGEKGLIRALGKNETLELIPSLGPGLDLRADVTRKNPAYLAEALIVIPYSGRTLDRLDAYNAIGKVADLKGRLYPSHARNAEVPLFEDATRIKSERDTSPVPDPAPAGELPVSETVYIRVKDVNFGNSYYRGELSASPYGIIYSLTNFRTLSFLIFTVLKEEKFTATMYMEPLAEGMLIYIVAGADASDFISKRIDIPSAMAKRGAVFVGWIADNIRTAGNP